MCHLPTIAPLNGDKPLGSSDVDVRRPNYSWRRRLGDRGLFQLGKVGYTSDLVRYRTHVVLCTLPWCLPGASTYPVGGGGGGGPFIPAAAEVLHTRRRKRPSDLVCYRSSPTSPALTLASDKESFHYHWRFHFHAKPLDLATTDRIRPDPRTHNGTTVSR